MTTVLLGPAPCRGCGTSVTVVRRPLVVWCDDRCRACAAQKGTKHRIGVETSIPVVVTQDGHGAPHFCTDRRAGVL